MLETFFVELSNTTPLNTGAWGYRLIILLFLEYSNLKLSIGMSPGLFCPLIHSLPKFYDNESSPICHKFNFSYMLICEEGIVGDSVKIVNEQASLTLCEVKIFGDDTPVIG